MGVPVIRGLTFGDYTMAPDSWKPSYRNCRGPTNMMVLVAESMALPTAHRAQSRRGHTGALATTNTVSSLRST